MTRRILEGASLAKFEDSTVTRGTETLEHFTQVLEDMGAYVFPRRVLQMEKRYMRRYMRKPRKLKMREYMARVEELNHDLRYFPTYAPGTRLHEDELLDIYEYGVPANWQKRFLLQGFDPLEHTKQEFLEFWERLEATEEIFEIHTGAKRKANPKERYKVKEGISAPAARSSAGYARNNLSQKSRFCRLHCQQQSHDTGTCKVLLNQADKMKATWKTQPSQQPYQKKHFNSKKPFERNSDSRYNSDYKKRELTSTEQKKTHFQMEKRHKSESEEQYMASISTASLTKDNTLDLENFNYGDTFKDDQLSIASSMNYMTPLEDSSFTVSDPE
jgi:hypothetical protein